MVSPSKIHQQQKASPQQQLLIKQKLKYNNNGDNITKVPTTAETTTTTTNVAKKASATAARDRANSTHLASCRIQKGPKPLEKKTFYLDIKNHAFSTKLEAKIKELGGAIELFLVKNVNFVVTDRTDKSPGVPGSADKRNKWGYASGGSGGPPSLRSIEVQTPTPTPPTPYRSVEGPLSNSTSQRGQAIQRSKSRVDAMLERALTQPQQCSVDPLTNALNWGIPIWSTYELQSWLEKIAASLKDANCLKRDNRSSSDKTCKIKHLKEPYIKFESYHRDTRPVFLELQAWPKINFDGDQGSCPFDVARKEKKETAAINKEVKENREKYFNPNISKGKDMTRRPRATATRARKTENTGYCEICRIDYKNLSKHLQSDQHLNFVRNDKNFLSLDNLINTGASVEAFLKINRTKDVGKDCDLFSHSLDNGILSADEKSEKNDNLSMNEFNMMQCNGARRNLNLDSPHNLRTRAKPETGHLLRSKGKPWDEEEKSEKSQEKYIIKKRAKGTIWIEEDDSENDQDLENEVVDFNGKPLSNHKSSESDTKKTANNGENPPNYLTMNGDVNDSEMTVKRRESSTNKVSDKDNVFKESLLEATLRGKINGYDKNEDTFKLSEASNHGAEQQQQSETKEVNHVDVDVNAVKIEVNEEKILPPDNEDTNSLKSEGRCRPFKKGLRVYRGKQRLSVEERLIEDNREYYKVEVLGNKLRSSAIPLSSIPVSTSKEPAKDQEVPKKDENKPSSEKPVVVRFKRVRKSELSLLSDEAESFMFGDPRREDDSSEASDNETSILPKDTESDKDETVKSLVISSSPPVNTTTKQEAAVGHDEDSQDSNSAGRCRKRRRTHTEALIKDNTDYYKFETPGSRLRYQAPLTGISEIPPDNDLALQSPEAKKNHNVAYPSKPSPEIEKMHFSFEAVPRSEPWYQTYQRQDEGDEYYYSESDSQKPFLLPYEIENFHEILQKSIQSSLHRKRGRGRGGGHANVGSRLPRKSPRCHASTLAIMSTIIRRREQPAANSAAAEEERKAKSAAAAAAAAAAETAKAAAAAAAEKKISEKSDSDAELREIVKNIELMLSEDLEEAVAFEVDCLPKIEEDAVLEPIEVPPKGPPDNLLELLDNCHEMVAQNGLENSSCASSECGENNEFPSRRRKKRKNKTGWPGNKLRRKMHTKHLNEELQKDLENGEESERISVELDETLSHDDEDAEETAEVDAVKEDKPLPTSRVRANAKGNRRRTKSKSSENKDADEGKIVLKSDDETTTTTSRRKKHADSNDKFSTKVKVKIEVIDEDYEIEPRIKGTRYSSGKGTLSSISEDSEESMSNNEIVCTKVESKGKSRSQSPRKRKRNNTTSSEASQSTEVGSQRNSGYSSSPRKKQRKDRSESQDFPSDRVAGGRKNKKGFKKHRPNERTPSKVTNCKKQSFLSPGVRRRLKRLKRSSSDQQNGEIDPAERLSPSEVDQRRSSIDYQPVVRVMKIEDQVEIESVSSTVASNRRLRSSSSPRSRGKGARKRARTAAGRRQVLKNS